MRGAGERLLLGRHPHSQNRELSDGDLLNASLAPHMIYSTRTHNTSFKGLDFVLYHRFTKRFTGKKVDLHLALGKPLKDATSSRQFVVIERHTRYPHSTNKQISNHTIHASRRISQAVEAFNIRASEIMREDYVLWRRANQEWMESQDSKITPEEFRQAIRELIKSN